MKQTFRLLPWTILFLWGSLSCTTPLRAQSQKTEEKTPRHFFLTTKPQTLLVGANIGIETALADKLSIAGDITVHCWLFPANISIAPSLKYRFRGNEELNFYGRAKLVLGSFLSKTAVDDKPYYAGGGLSIGGIAPLNKTNKIFLFGEVGLQYVPPFGHRPGSTIADGEAGIAYYSLISPASIPDVAVGIAFKL